MTPEALAVQARRLWKGLRMMIANGDELVAFDDEGHRRRFWPVVVTTTDQVCRHERGALVLIKAA